MRRFLASILVFGALACGGGTPAAPVTTVDGTWNGNAGGYQVSLGLTQTDTTVTGTGIMAGNTGVVQLDVQGTFHTPDVSLTLTASGFAEQVLFTGKLSATAPQITGQLNGSGFNQLSITLNKK